MLSSIDREAVLKLAEYNMNITAAALSMHMHRNTLVYHIQKIMTETGLDPRCFYDLIKLVELANMKEVKVVASVR